MVAEAGGVADEEMIRVFNLGLGMLAVVPDGEVAGAIASLASAGHEAHEVGRSKTYELIAEGLLESVHIGRSTRVPVAALHDLLDRLRDRRHDR